MSSTEQRNCNLQTTLNSFLKPATWAGFVSCNAMMLVVFLAPLMVRILYIPFIMRFAR